MTLHPNLSRRVSAGEILKPWLVLGPFYENISSAVPGLTLFEEPGGRGGWGLMEEIAAAATIFLTGCQPCEGDEDHFRGQTGAWKLVRGPEQFLTWGSYHTQNHLNVTLLSTLVEPDRPGLIRWKLSTRISSAVIVALNGTVVCDSGLYSARIMEGQEEAEYTFEAELAPGENRLCVALLRAGRMARCGLRLVALDGDLAVRVALPLPGGMPAAARSQVEEQVSSIQLERDVLYPEHALTLHLAAEPNPAAPLRVRLETAGGDVVWETMPPAHTAGPVELCQAAELADGAYQLCCEWLTRDGRVLTASAYHLQKTTPTEPLPGFERLAERKRAVLDFYAAANDTRPLWNQIARYALGDYARVEEGVVRDACVFVAARNDTADFVMQGILRLLYWERKTPRLSANLRELMKETVLNFKYWVDEPGDTVMWMDSENHRFLFHSAEWLAGQLYPLEEFSNSRQRGLFHALKGRTYACEWMRQRGCFGFDEWHSNTYYPASMLPLFNIYDFAPYEDHKFRLLAGALLDYMFFNLAADSYQGAFGTTHGRTYVPGLIHADFEGTAGLAWLAYGQGALRREGGAMAPVAMATSVYRLPRILAEIAVDRTAVVESRVRQGIASKGEQEFFAHNRDRFADFRVYRTPDYMLCGLQDYRKGEYEPAVHVAQVTLANKAVIFWSCPYTTNEGGGLRPDYWSGNTSLPRVVQQQNVLALTFRLAHDAWMSHCFFETARFDEVRSLYPRQGGNAGNWVFARVGGGYVGIWSQGGFQTGDFGQYAGRELICEAAENTWLVEGGRAADYGSFEAFASVLSAAPIQVVEGVVTYDSPSIGRFVTGWDAVPSLNGEPIALHDYPLVSSPWADSDFGSGRIHIHYGDQTHELYFG